MITVIIMCLVTAVTSFGSCYSNNADKNDTGEIHLMGSAGCYMCFDEVPPKPKNKRMTPVSQPSNSEEELVSPPCTGGSEKTWAIMPLHPQIGEIWCYKMTSEGYFARGAAPKKALEHLGWMDPPNAGCRIIDHIEMCICQSELCNGGSVAKNSVLLLGFFLLALLCIGLN